MAEKVNACFVIWIFGLLVWGYIKFRLHRRSHQPFFIVSFGLLLLMGRIVTALLMLGNKVAQQRPKLPPKSRLVIEKVVDYLSAFQLKPTEVILGMAPGRRPVRVNIMEEHTMLGGSTGGGKTWLLHAILIQLFGKGRIFTDQVKVYILDMKANRKDMLSLWEPLCAGFARRGIDGSLDDALAVLRHIDRLLQAHTEDRIFLIIEEAPVLTENTEADKIIERIASQLRLNGSLLMTVQHAHNTVVRTVTKHNVDRRIGGMVKNITQMEVLLEVRPNKKELPVNRGQYLLSETGQPKLIAFTALKPDLPAEIEEVVANTLEAQAESDERLKILWDVAANKQKGAAIVGARQMADNIEWLPNAQFRLLVAYRNFAQAGAFIAPAKHGERSYLAVEFPEAFRRVRQYIDDGRWEKEPNSLERMKDEDSLSGDQALQVNSPKTNRRRNKTNPPS